LNIAHSAVFLLAGAFTGFLSVLSCGDNWNAPPPRDAPADTPDASTVCECPAAESPLADRLVVVSNTRLVESKSDYGGGVNCPDNAHVLTGSCSTVDDINALDVTLWEASAGRGSSPPYLEGWGCSMYNNEPAQVTFRTSALCLKAAP
jgi:hypothetical protein